MKISQSSSLAIVSALLTTVVATGRTAAADLRPHIAHDRLPGAPVSGGVCQTARVRPDAIVLSTDGSALVSGYSHHGRVSYNPGPAGNLRWAHWTSTSASTRAYLWIDDGYPSIGGGTFYAVAADIRLTSPVSGIFTRMTITPHADPKFKPNRYWITPITRTYRSSGCGNGPGVGWNASSPG